MRPMQRTAARLQAIIRDSREAGGFTVNPHNGRAPYWNPDEYLVSLPGEVRYRTVPSVRDLHQWLLRRWAEVAEPGRYVGGWWDGDELVLDVTVAIRGRDRALLQAAAWGQQAVFHPCTGDCIEVTPGVAEVARAADVS